MNLNLKFAVALFPKKFKMQNPVAWSFSLGVFETVVWALDPFTSHERMEHLQHVIRVVSYALPPLLVAFFHASPRAAGYYFPFILYNCIDVFLNEWFPYLCGVHRREWAASEARRERLRATRVPLPALCGRAPPLLEHALHTPLLLGTLYAFICDFAKLSPASRVDAKGALQFSSALFVLVLAVRVAPEAQRALRGQGAGGGGGDGPGESAGSADGLPFDYTVVIRVSLVLSALAWAWLALAA